MSVVVPTRNRPELLREALASIRALEGRGARFEILVGDNGSTPDTRGVCEAYGARYLPVDRLGAGAGRNAGLQAAQGEYIAFLDDDDRWLPDHLFPHLDRLRQDPKIDAVISQVVTGSPTGELISAPWPDSAPAGRDALLRRMLSGYFPQIGTAVCRRCVVDRCGLFDEALLGGQDLDWLLRLARRGRLAWIPVASVMFRSRPLGVDNSLNLSRIKFDRRVFLRHAVPEWRIWRSPKDFQAAYVQTLWHYFHYFSEVAKVRAEQGDVAGALQGVGATFRVLPLRAAVSLITPTALRGAMVNVARQVLRGRRPA